MELQPSVARPTPIERVPSLSVDGLLDLYWRRRPVVVTGGADQLLRRRWTGADFTAALHRARRAGTRVHELAGEVVFVEAVSDHDPYLAARARALGRQFGAACSWFDAVQTMATTSVTGIGSHFDHSDNLVLQQEGRKRWHLAPAKVVRPADRARRMLLAPDVGAYDLPEAGQSVCELEPGDLLYIPLLWVHQGEADGKSLSLSYVCPARSLHATLLPALARALQRRGLGHQPVPTVHGGLDDHARDRIVSDVTRAARALVEAAARDDAVWRAVEVELRASLAGEASSQAGEVPDGSGTARG